MNARHFFALVPLRHFAIGGPFISALEKKSFHKCGTSPKRYHLAKMRHFANNNWKIEELARWIFWRSGIFLMKWQLFDVVTLFLTTSHFFDKVTQLWVLRRAFFVAKWCGEVTIVWQSDACSIDGNWTYSIFFRRLMRQLARFSGLIWLFTGSRQRWCQEFTRK